MLQKQKMHCLTLQQFFDHSTERKYYALVWGDVENSGTIEGHIGRSLKNRKVMTVSRW